MNDTNFRNVSFMVIFMLILLVSCVGIYLFATMDSSSIYTSLIHASDERQDNYTKYI